MEIEHKFLNKQEADVLFHRRAVAFGTWDVLPVGRAVELFGPAAVQNIIDRSGPDCFGCWRGVAYLTYTGFMQLVTQHNAALAKYSGMDAIKWEA